MYRSATHTQVSPALMWAKKSFKSVGVKGVQGIYLAWGEQMSRTDPVVWHVWGKS